MPRITGTQTAPGVFAPMLMFDIEINGARATLPGILDSGADRTIVPLEYVEPAGVVFANLPPPTGISIGAGGKFEARVCRGKIAFRGIPVCDEFLVASGGCLPMALLGRSDFMVKFSVRFNWHRKPPTVDIDPVAKP